MELQHRPSRAAEKAKTLPHPGDGRTDALSDVLRVVKLTGALFFISQASTPWGTEVPRAETFAPIILPRARHVVSYHIILKGSGWAGIPGVASTSFEAGDILVFPHGDPHSLLSAPGQPPEFDAAATLQFLRDMAAGKIPFVVQEGGGGPERTDIVCGFLACDMRPFNPVLATMPRLLHVKRRPEGQPDLLERLIELTLAEAQSDRAGRESIHMRLSELMFVEVVRRHLETQPMGQTGWLAGLRDASVGRALALLHRSPAHPWTLIELARQAGVSRAVLANRFAHLVGYPPMQYLTLWRMQVAAHLLAERSMKVAAVAYEVGYQSEAAFSRTFKKITGVTPAAWPIREAGD